mmetsp:Transcript_18196/g.31012  ORF Transcript_18196/g.31012 Transcript_18196/m.31012 type:complete len:90 (+) Transcript_18196:392-661(+)
MGARDEESLELCTIENEFSPPYNQMVQQRESQLMPKCQKSSFDMRSRLGDKTQTEPCDVSRERKADKCSSCRQSSLPLLLMNYTAGGLL